MAEGPMDIQLKAEIRRSMEFKLGFAWWWWLYFYGLMFISMVSGRAPDLGKIHKTVMRAARIQINGRWYPLDGDVRKFRRFESELYDWSSIELLPRLRLLVPDEKRLRSHVGIGFGWLNFWLHIWL